MWQHIIAYSGGSFTTRLIVELQPPNLTQPITWGFLVMLVLTLGVLARTWRHVPITHYLLLAGWTFLAFQQARNILLFAVLIPGLLAPRIAELLNRPPGLRVRWWGRYRLVTPARSGTPVVFGLTLVVLLMLAAIGSSAETGPLLHARWTQPPFPIAATRFLQTSVQAPQGNMFNDITWGGYLLDMLYPERRVFISTQQDAYGDTLNRDYLTAEYAQPGWQDVLGRYDVQWVIDQPTSPLVHALRALPEPWQTLYADETAVILARR